VRWGPRDGIRRERLCKCTKKFYFCVVALFARGPFVDEIVWRTGVGGELAKSVLVCSAREWMRGTSRT